MKIGKEEGIIARLLFFIKDKNSKNAKKAPDFVSEKDKENIAQLTAEEIKAEKEYKDKTRQLDNQIIQVQRSTKTSIPALQRYHETMRMRYEWYYKWHLWPYSRVAHFLILGVYLFFLTLFGVHFFSTPKPVLAAGNTCTSAVASGDWSVAGTWDAGCAGGAPQTGDFVVISAGNAITLSAPASVASVTVTGTLDISGQTLTLSGVGTPLTVTGTFTTTNSTVKYTGTSATNVASVVYKNLQFSGAGPYNLAGTLNGAKAIGGTLTIDSGATFNPGSYGLGVTGAFSNAGSFGISNSGSSGIHAFQGTWTNSGTYYLSNNVSFTTTINNNVVCSGTLDATSNRGLTIGGSATTVDFTNGTYTKGTGILTFSKADNSAITFTPSTSDFGAVNVRSSTLNKYLTVTVAADLTLTSLTLGRNISGSIYYGNTIITDHTMTVTGTGTPLSLAFGTLTTTNSTVKYTGTAATNVTATTYNNLTFDDTNNNVTYTLALGTTSATGTVTITGGTLDIGANTLNITGDLSNSDTITISTGTLDIGGNITVGTLTCSDASVINIGGNWTNNGTFTANSGTVTFNGTGYGKTINPGASSFYNLTFNGSGGAWSPLTNPVTITNNLTMTAGTFDTSNGTANVMVNGNTIGTAGMINMTSTNTFTQFGPNFGTTSGSVDWTFNNLLISALNGGTGTTTTSAGGTGKIIVVDTLTVGGGYPWINRTFDNETNDRILDVKNISILYNSFTMAPYTLIASSTASFTVSGNWTNNGTFTPGTGTVTFDGTNEATISGSTTFNNLVMNTTGIGAKTIKFPTGLGSKQTINGTWTLDGDAGKILTLASVSPNTAWEFVIPADFTAGDYINVQDSQNNTNANRITPGTNVNDLGNNDPGWIFNQPPNNPTNLVQKKTDDTVIAAGGWTNEASVKYTATVTDPDANQVKLCVEKKPTGTDFTPAADLCGALVDSGSTAEVTIPGQDNNVQYHWHVYAQDSNTATSGWVDYGTDPAYGIYLTTSYTLTATSPQVVGVGWSETVMAKDSGLATVTSANNMINMTSSSGTVKFYTSNSYNVPTTSYTLAGGTVTVYLKDTNTATENITYAATDSSPHSATGTSGAISVVNDPPSSAITTPATGTTVGVGTVQILGTADDAFGGYVDKVEIRVNNTGAWQEAVNTGTHFSSWSYDVNLPSSGDYIIQSRATDSFGAVEVPGAGITVHVSTDLPTVQVTKPTQNEWITLEPYDVTGVVTAPSGTTISKVEVSLDSVAWFNATNTGTNFSSWKYTLTNIPDGQYVLQTRTTNSLNIVSAVYTVNFGIDTVSPTKPGNFSAFNVSNHLAGTSQALLWWQASTDEISGIKEYQIFRGTEKIGTTDKNYFIDDNPVAGQYQVKAIDNAGNMTSSDEATLDLAVSSAKMTISDVKAMPSALLDGNGKTSVVISWKTDQPSTSLVYYGLGGAKALQAGIDNQLNMSHTVVLTNLDPNTIYHFAVLSKDIYGDKETSADQIFSTVSSAASDTVWNKVIQVFRRSFQWVQKSMADPILEKMGLIQTPEQVSPQMMVFNVSVPVANTYQSFISYSGDNGFILERSTNGRDFTQIANENITNVNATNVNAYYFDQNLAADTNYYYRVKDVPGMVSFRTSGKDTIPPVISGFTTKNLGQNKTQAEVLVSYQTDKMSTTEVNINDKTYKDDSLNQTHIVLVDNLKAGQNYDFSVKSTDDAGFSVTAAGSIAGKETSSSESSFGVIINVIQNKFSQFAGWMRK